MTDPTFNPASDRELLVVYPDRERAVAAQRALIGAGVADREIHLDDEPDTIVSLRAEMHEELSRAWIVPNAGVAYPKEAARGLVVMSAIGVAVGVLAAFPLALIDFGSTYWVRWVVFAAVGVGFGLAVALVVGPALGSPRPGELSAAVRGTLLRVGRDTRELRELLIAEEPVRLDVVTHDGDPIDTVMTEGDTVTNTVKDMAANVEGDDYHPQR